MKLKQIVAARLIALLAAVFFVSSCGDQDLVQKNEELSASISQLKQEVALLKADLKESPGALSSQLKQLDATLKKTVKQSQELKSKKLELDNLRAELERQIEALRQKLLGEK